MPLIPILLGCIEFTLVEAYTRHITGTFDLSATLPIPLTCLALLSTMPSYGGERKGKYHRRMIALNIVSLCVSVLVISLLASFAVPHGVGLGIRFVLDGVIVFSAFFLDRSPAESVQGIFKNPLGAAWVVASASSILFLDAIHTVYAQKIAYGTAVMSATLLKWIGVPVLAFPANLGNYARISDLTGCPSLTINGFGDGFQWVSSFFFFVCLWRVVQPMSDKSRLPIAFIVAVLTLICVSNVASISLIYYNRYLNARAPETVSVLLFLLPLIGVATYVGGIAFLSRDRRQHRQKAP